MKKKRNVTLISPSITNIGEYDSYHELFLKKVFSKSGDYIGKVRDIISTGNQVVGFIVGKGFKNVFIDKNFITTSPEAVQILSIDPFTLLLGKHVYDLTGRYIGRVKTVNRDNNKNDNK